MNKLDRICHMAANVDRVVKALSESDTLENCKSVCIETRLLVASIEERVLFTRKVDNHWKEIATSSLQLAKIAMEKSKAVEAEAYMRQCVAERFEFVREVSVERVLELIKG